MEKIAYFHLPGLFEQYEFYKKFLTIFFNNREYFYDWCEIASIYGSPIDTIWSGGRVSTQDENPNEVAKTMNTYKISSRLTFSNSLLESKHLDDKKCNELCTIFSAYENNGVIVHSDLLKEYLKDNYPNLYLVSSTTKVLTDFNDFINEVKNDDFKYVVPDFRLNKSFEKLNTLNNNEKSKIEFLCNECCPITCSKRKQCYINVSKINLNQDPINYHCVGNRNDYGYRFSDAKKNPAFISLEDIQNTYLKMGFNNFKIEGRGLGSALILEFILYYLTKPKYQLIVREEMYLHNSLDLF